jgi:hypothetical protein
MTYSVGGLIQAADYNTFQTNLNSIWSTGTTDGGWGQTELTGVSASGIVTATNWASLVNNLAISGAQTDTALTARTAPVTGDVIAILSNLATDISSVSARRGYATSSGATSSTWTGSVSETDQTGSGTGAWNITWTQTVTFPSADQARYFWNAGGLVRLDMSKTSTGLDMDEDWNNLVSTVGTLYLSGRVNNANQVIAGTTYTGFTRIGGSGTPSPFQNTIGWYQLSPGSTLMFELTSSVSPYAGGSTIVVYAAATNFLQNLVLSTVWSQADRGASSTAISGGTATTSPYAGSPGTAPTVLCRFIPPSTAQGLTNTWGTPTVNSSKT